MNMREQIILLCETYATAAGIGTKRVSFIVFNRGSKLDDIRAGGDLNTGTFEKTVQWFSDNWPEGAAWPAQIARPAPTMVAAE